MLRAVDETQCGIEIRFDFLDADAALELGRVRRPHAHTPSTVVALAPFRRALLIPGLGLERSAIRQARVLVAKVDAGDAVVDIRERVAIGDDEADGGLCQHIRRDAPDEQVRRLDVLELVLPDCERADRPTARAAAQLRAALEIHGLSRGAQADTAREKRQRILLERARERRIHRPLPDAAELEDVGILEKKVAPLGEEQAEPRQIDLPIVDFGRREIGVERQAAFSDGVSL